MTLFYDRFSKQVCAVDQNKKYECGRRGIDVTVFRISHYLYSYGYLTDQQTCNDSFTSFKKAHEVHE